MRLPLVDGSRLRALALALAAVLALALAAPEPAHAQSIMGGFTDAIKDTLGWVFHKFIGLLFGSLQTAVGEAFGKWLTSIPNFDLGAVSTGVGGPVRGNIDELRQATTALALGGLTAVVTLTVVRYWVAGLSLSGAGGIEALEGFGRALLAVAMILLWPEFFRLTVALANSATYALLDLPSVRENFRDLWGTLAVGSLALAPTSVGAILPILVVTASVVMLLMLAVMKIMLTATTAFLFVAMPVLLVLWPLPETSWLARTAGRAYVVCIAVPLTWTLLFTTFAALGDDVLTWQGPSQGVLDRIIIKPLATIALLWLAIKLPRALGKAALMGAVAPGVRPTGSGFLSHMTSFMAARQLSGALAERFPALRAENLAQRIPGYKPEDGGAAGGNRNGGGRPRGSGPGGGGDGDRGGGAAAALAAGSQPPLDARAVKRAGAVFKWHDNDPQEFTASRADGNTQLGRWQVMTPAERDAARPRLERAAVQALAAFSPSQRDALEDVFREEDIAVFAGYTSHLSYSPHLSDGQKAAAQQLSGMPASVLDRAFSPPRPVQQQLPLSTT
jgi:hypothetical protein